KHAVGVEVTDNHVCIVLDVEIGANATTRGRGAEFRVDADARSFSIGDGLCENRVTLAWPEVARSGLCRRADLEARARRRPGGRCARARDKQHADRGAENSTPPHMGVSERMMYTIQHTQCQAQ